jgi:3-oxoacyl-[acyl-carrier protein] reductase
VVRQLADDGYDVTFTYHASAEKAEELVAYSTVGSINAVRVDLTDMAAVQEVAELVATSGAFHAFVHCAGQTCDGLAVAKNIEAARVAMDVNFWSMVVLFQRLVRPMMAAHTGRVVLVGSLVAERGNRGNAFYAATKGALASFARSCTDELAARGLTINVVAPGYVDTPMMDAYRARGATLESRIPAGRFANADEVASLIRFLLGDDAAYINGATIMVDGGLHATLGTAR